MYLATVHCTTFPAVSPWHAIILDRRLLVLSSYSGQDLVVRLSHWSFAMGHFECTPLGDRRPLAFVGHDRYRHSNRHLHQVGLQVVKGG